MRKINTIDWTSIEDMEDTMMEDTIEDAPMKDSKSRFDNKQDKRAHKEFRQSRKQARGRGWKGVE